ncbi:MAG: DNA polymerase IV [Candidatus Marinimicrobia bacterium]|nr:DNA polymerase IV [Candidatus Neomarinimicrobiota bacterium]
MDHRKIIHVDMDAFYASVEQRDHPEYRGKPVAVGGSKIRGVVAAASYEARKYGIHSAMPSRTAYKKCPHIIFVRPHFDVYTEVSRQIMKIFRDYTDKVEPLSLDEAYLDVTCNKVRFNSASQIAKEIRARIKAETQLTASAGVSYNKFLAKIASDINKPDGLTVIPPEKAIDFLEKLPIEKFYGIGKVTAEKMKSVGIHNGMDLKQWSREDLLLKFGKSGGYYFHAVRGEDNREVSSIRIRKSLGAERTFDTDLKDRESMVIQLGIICRKVWERMEKKQFAGRTLTLKIKYHDFEVNTRSRTFGESVIGYPELLEKSLELLNTPHPPKKPVRLLGVSFSNLEPEKAEESVDQITLNF